MSLGSFLPTAEGSTVAGWLWSTLGTPPGSNSPPEGRSLPEALCRLCCSTINPELQEADKPHRAEPEPPAPRWSPPARGTLLLHGTGQEGTGSLPGGPASGAEGLSEACPS